MLWHIVWLFGCFALTYFIMVILNVLTRVRKVSLSKALPVSKYVTSINLVWACVFIVLSIVDGLSPSWPHPAVQWFVWMLCALYLLGGTTYSVFTLRRIMGKATPSTTGKMNNTMDMLVLFSYAIIAGLAAYSMFLPALGILRAAFPESNDLLAESIITVFHQVGMLCMGLGMQFGTTQITGFRTNNSKSENSNVTNAGRVSKVTKAGTYAVTVQKKSSNTPETPGSSAVPHRLDSKPMVIDVKIDSKESSDMSMFKRGSLNHSSPSNFKRNSSMLLKKLSMRAPSKAYPHGIPPGFSKSQVEASPRRSDEEDPTLMLKIPTNAGLKMPSLDGEVTPDIARRRLTAETPQNRTVASECV
uniref:Uncharacterized protein n=2 Tax=Lotharella globosa TaxID=91324 RepID=A0A7S4E0E8_9EUKA